MDTLHIAAAAVPRDDRTASMIHRLLHIAHCPVLVVPPEDRRRED